MKVKTLLIEDQLPVICIDIQPAMEKYIHFNISNFINDILVKSDNIFYFYDNQFIDDKNDIIHFLANEYSASKDFDDVLSKISFKEKSYGFFRSWMDAGISTNIIISMAKKLIHENLNCSNELFNKDEDAFNKIVGNNHPTNLEDDPLYLPQFDYGFLKNYKNYNICGGSEDECLLEFCILLDVLDIKYTIINKYVY